MRHLKKRPLRPKGKWTEECWKIGKPSRGISPLAPYIPLDIQEKMLLMMDSGADSETISKMYGAKVSATNQLRENGGIFSTRCHSYRCPGCGATCDVNPCIACHVRKRIGAK